MDVKGSLIGTVGILLVVLTVFVFAYATVSAASEPTAIIVT